MCMLRLLPDVLFRLQGLDLAVSKVMILSAAGLTMHPAGHGIRGLIVPKELRCMMRQLEMPASLLDRKERDQPKLEQQLETVPEPDRGPDSVSSLCRTKRLQPSDQLEQAPQMKRGCSSIDRQLPAT